jgi:hypothetical protein
MIVFADTSNKLERHIMVKLLSDEIVSRHIFHIILAFADTFEAFLDKLLFHRTPVHYLCLRNIYSTRPFLLMARAGGMSPSKFRDKKK